MQIDWWTLALQTINLLVLLWILGRFLFRPIARIIEERQAAAAKILDDTKHAREQAEAALEQARKETADAAAARSGALAEAATQAKEEKARLIKEAREEAEKLRQQAGAEIEHMRKNAMAEYGRQASRLAVDIAQQLFERLPDSAKVDGFIDGLASAIGDMPEGARAEIGAEGAPLVLKAARPLTPEETETCRKAIADALGRSVDLETKVDPSLIAGLELEAAHAEIRNNFRADLERIAKELTRDSAKA